MKRILLLSALLLTIGARTFAQTHVVTGKIVDENGLGYPGAGITVKGTQLGTVTDVNGNFSLDVPDANHVIVVHAIGYSEQTVTESGAPLTIKLAPSAKQLEGAVVTALGIKREARALGYSTTTLNSEDLTSGEGTSALSDLAGKVAGANVSSTTGGPGGDTRVVLRGEKSILKDNNALIVIDGVIMNNYDRTQDNTGLAQIDFGNSANDLDPDEIESVTVLSGPAAAALYGSAGANGAIMYTTKKGKHNANSKNSKMDITFKTTWTSSDVLKYPEYQTQFGEGAPGSTPGSYSPDDRPDNFSWGPAFTNQLQPWGQVINGQQQVKPYSSLGSTPISQFFQRGKDLQNFLSISGGNDASTYYLSIGSLNSSGVIPLTGNNRYSIRFNGHTDLGNNFYSDINVNYINSNARAAAQGQSTGGIMQSLLQVPVDEPIAPLANQSSHFNSMNYIDSTGVHRFGYFGDFAANPYWMAQNYVNTNQTDHVIGDLKVGYKKGDFNVYDRVGMDVTDDRSSYETPKISSQSVDQTSYYPDFNYTNNGGFQQNAYTGMRFQNDLIATYTHQLSENFGMNALAGTNTSISNDETQESLISPKTSGLVVPGFYSFQNNSGPVNAFNTLTQGRSQAIYADVSFNFQKEIYLDLTARNEWSSTLEQSHDSYFYPGGNASWIFTERLKGKIKDIINYGKLRAGVASVSSGAIPYANNSALYAQNPINSSFGSIVTPFNGVPTYQIIPSFGQNSIKPELTSEYEVGTDLSFLKNRITFKFTYYDDLTHNLISNVPTPPSSGYLQNYINVGTVSNKGEEISLSGTPISTKWGLKWDLFGTYTHNVNDVVSLNGGVSQITLGGGGFQGMAIVAAVGHPLGTFYASDISYEQGSNGQWHAIVNQQSGLPVPTSSAVLKGSYQPKFQASWGTDLSYKQITLHVLFTTKQGGEFYDQNKSLMDFVGSAQETTTNNRNPLYWPNSVYVQTGTGSGTGTPAVYVPNDAAHNGTQYLPYNYWVTQVGQNVLPAQNLVNASYIRLQEIKLGYKIPSKYYSRSPFGALEAGVFGNNLVLWTAKSNKYDDPEENTSGATSNAQGFNYSATPSLRNYGAYIKVTF